MVDKGSAAVMAATAMAASVETASLSALAPSPVQAAQSALKVPRLSAAPGSAAMVAVVDAGL
jgi:hypothetical protein